MVIRVFVSLTSGNIEMRGQQEYIRRVFDQKHIPYEEIDIAAPHCAESKKFMQDEVRKTTQSTASDIENKESIVPVLPPQLFHGNSYRGDYTGFFEAVETESVFKYLGLPAPEHEVEYIRQVTAGSS